MICDKTIDFPDWDSSDKNSCVVDYCTKLMDSVRKESCGKTVFCREGTWQIYEIMKDISEGNGRSGDIELLKELLEQTVNNADCEMTRKASNTCIELLQSHEDEWEKHQKRKICSNLVCKGMYTLYIDPMLCDGCGKCMFSCISKAIRGGENMIHVIDTQLCSKSLQCINVCPKNAIKKAGAIKPNLPNEPIPVGSIEEKSEDQSGTTMRRRRRG